VPRTLACLTLLLLAFGASGCGDGEGGTLRERADRLEERLRDQRDRIRARIEKIVGQIEQAIPSSPASCRASTRTGPRR
jgi:hypothetical protein